MAPDSSDSIPKRISNTWQNNRFFAITLPLILINATVANLLTTQVFAVTQTDRFALVKDDTTTLPEADDAATDTDAEESIDTDNQPVITTYVVKSGDTLSGIAEKFNISVNTIRWANDLTSKTSKIQIGDELTILPVSGVEYTVKKGDTLSGIASKYDVSQDDILAYNDIEANAIKVGTKLILPNAEPITPKITPTVKKTTTVTKTTSIPSVTTTSKVVSDDSDETPMKFINPIPGAILTQGLHDGNAVDFGAPIGTTVRAAADGTVIIAKSSGYNGGYGQYIVINHENGAQTLYGHLSSVAVTSGQTVSQGETIGKSGNSGRSTGPHLHYKEIGSGARNTFANYKKGTQF